MVKTSRLVSKNVILFIILSLNTRTFQMFILNRFYQNYCCYFFIKNKTKEHDNRMYHKISQIYI